VDNGADLCDIRLDTAKALTVHGSSFGAPVIRASGKRRKPEGFRALYRPYRPDEAECELTFVPYYAFANRGESEMLVWVRI
jgi:DUF1680 family protein